MRRAVGVAMAVVSLLVPRAEPPTTEPTARAFVEVSSLTDADAGADRAAGGERLLFLPLHESFAGCVPLDGPCPADSSTLLLVEASGRRVAWAPEGADLPGAGIDALRVRAVGAAPPDADGSRFLVPVVDGAGVAVSYAPARFDAGFLVAAGDAHSDEAVTPRLDGPALVTQPPTDDVPDRVVDRPAVVDADDLDDATPVLLVRRASPHRVIYAVAADPAWAIAADAVPLLDDGVIAVVARHRPSGDVGLAVPARADLEPGSRPDAATGARTGDSPGSDRSGSRDGGDGTGPIVVAALIVVAVALLLAFVFGRRRRTRVDDIG